MDTWSFITSPIFQGIVIGSGAIFSLWQFRRNNRIKAAEIFNSLEVNFMKHIHILNAIEFEQKYTSFVEPALINSKEKIVNDETYKIILKLDKMLRHFHTCARISWKLRVDNGVLTDAYYYYITFFMRDDRNELRKYVEKNWPSVYNWGVYSLKPWPTKIFIYIVKYHVYNWLSWKNSLKFKLK